MNKVKIALGVAALALFLSLTWQVGACELANIELKDDMQDLASQMAMRIGFSRIASEDELRDAILRAAERYEIPLAANQVTVERTGEGLTSTVYIAADYRVPIHLPGYSFEIHFTPSSGKMPL